METAQAAQLLAAVAGAGALVSGLTQAIKGLVLPATWQTGRAPMLVTAGLALLAVIGAGMQLGFELGQPAVLYAGAAAWLTVYQAAVATHQTVSKVGRVVTGSTDPTGPDDAG